MEDLKIRLRTRSCSYKDRTIHHKATHRFSGSDPKMCAQDANSVILERRFTMKEDYYRRRALSSPASDLAARRGVFSRRHYGSVELLNSNESEGSPLNAGRFRVETGERDGEEPSSPLNSPVHLENPESQTRWYFKYFLGKLHQTYVGIDTDKDPFLLSVVVTDANNHNVPQYRAILWTKTGAKKICLPYNGNKPQTVKGILGNMDVSKLDKGPKEIFNPDIQKEILVLEEQEGSINFKFGVIYAKEGQSSDDEFFSNESGSEQFNEFVNFLGDSVKLKGWEKFRAGLDVKMNTTGEESLYTVYEGHEIMFHVSTWLPYSTENKQQVERKRHIGNDIVNIVFWDGDPNMYPSFKPSMMKTRFTHIFALVTYNAETYSYRLNVFSEESVPLFGPPLPAPPEFYHLQEFRDFLLVKLINGEKAAVNNPVFAQKRERTLEMLIKTVYLDYLPENNMLNRRAFSDVIQDVNTSRRKEDTRRAEFVRIGQTLKVKTILRGDAPTSSLTTGILKREPWEPQLCHCDFTYPIVTSDSWGDKLMIVTDQGTLVLEEGVTARYVFDKSVTIKQLNVVEAHGILIIRTDKGKDGKISVFRLLDFDNESSAVRSKADFKEHKLERTKGIYKKLEAVGKRKHCDVVGNWARSISNHLYWCAASSDGDGDLVQEKWFSILNHVTNIHEGHGEKFPRCAHGPLEDREWIKKGCHTYALSRPGTSHLRMTVGVGRKVLLFTWKHSVEWLAWCCPTVDMDTVDGFTFIRELECYECPHIISLIDSTQGLEKDSIRGDNQICIGYKNQFDLINEKNGDTLQLFQVDTHKNVNLVSAIDIYEDEEAELLLTYNYVSHFQKLKEETSFDFDIHWNSEPRAIVCAFPYVMAFTPDTIEIRLIVNGNLVHTMSMPDLTLISAKCDIYFASSAYPPPSPKERCSDCDACHSPPPSPSFKLPPSPSPKSNCPTRMMYKIPLTCLTGHMAPEKVTVISPVPANQSMLLPPVPHNAATSPCLLRRSPLLRTKCLHSHSSEKDKDRHDSSSSDSGITILKPSEFSPPESPSIVNCGVFTESELV